MELKKCERCGCFFTSQNTVCQNCITKDKNEIGRLKNFIELNSEVNSLNSLSINTGISEKNINRYLNSSELSNFTNNLNISL